MDNRFFTKQQKIAVEIVTGQTGDADHIMPFTNNGPTTVENCQLISKSLNSKKSDFVFEPRDWQNDFFTNWDNRKPSEPFLLIAIPGGGKTYAALEVARQWLRRGPDRRIVIVVPTDNLRTQLQDEAVNFGIELQTKEFGTNFKDGYTGVVTTYHAIGNNPTLFRVICHASPTMVIFDEVHHCGDKKHFGLGIKEAFVYCKEYLLLSGTPWKTDGTRIPFVNYDEFTGYAKGDFNYDYPRALNDEVVRYLSFEFSKGSIVSLESGVEEYVSEEISENQARQRLSKLLDAEGEYVTNQIIAAHNKLIEVRKDVPDAGALAVCIDQYHATRIATKIKSITGKEPSLIVSDSDLVNDTVKKFRKSNTEWLVAVNMVSEGTDIKRLQVFCHLTNVTTELALRQLWGRVVRYRDIGDEEAYVFLPSDPRLIKCAKNIMAAQTQALIKEEEKEPSEPFERTASSGYDDYLTNHLGTQVIVATGDIVPREEWDAVSQIQALGIPLKKAKQAFDLLKTKFSFDSKNMPAFEAENKPDQITKEERENKLRKACNAKANYLARLTGIEVKEVHRKFNNGKSQREMSEDELKSKLSTVKHEIRKIKIEQGGQWNV